MEMHSVLLQQRQRVCGGEFQLGGPTFFLGSKSRTHETGTRIHRTYCHSPMALEVIPLEYLLQQLIRGQLLWRLHTMECWIHTFIWATNFKKLPSWCWYFYSRVCDHYIIWGPFNESYYHLWGGKGSRRPTVIEGVSLHWCYSGTGWGRIWWHICLRFRNYGIFGVVWSNLKLHVRRIQRYILWRENKSFFDDIMKEWTG